jgi:hypothetical protein
MPAQAASNESSWEEKGYLDARGREEEGSLFDTRRSHLSSRVQSLS